VLDVHAEVTYGMPRPRSLGAAGMIIFMIWMNGKHILVSLAAIAATTVMTATTIVITATTSMRTAARRFVWSVIAAAVRGIVGASR